MNRTAAIAFPCTLFLCWWFYVATRSGSGPGLKWDRIPNHLYGTTAFIGSIYLVFVLIALTVLYFQRIRGSTDSAMSILVPAVVRFAVVFVVALALAGLLAELFVGADEHSFRKETQAFLATAKPVPETGDLPLYSRKRWWPGSSNMLVSPDSLSARR